VSAPAFPRPLPRVEGDAAPYWRALAQGRIELPRCRACGRWVFYPRRFCPACHSNDVAWEALEGRGTVYTFTVVRKPTHPFFVDRAPYVYGLVELAAGVRLPTTIVDCNPEELRIGDPAHAVFEKVDDEVTLLCFAPD
jgi:uncharacterized protein